MSYDLKAHVYCSCGTSVHVPIKTEKNLLNPLSVENQIREFGWSKSKLKLNNEEHWLCKRCSMTEQERKSGLSQHA